MPPLGPARNTAFRAGQGRVSIESWRIVCIYAVLISFNLLVWAAALLASISHPLLLGTALLAYTFGLRHAVDADHIAAIDNVTRKLMHEGKRPLAVGLWFSLGHSTVVILASIALVTAAAYLQADFLTFKEVGGRIGTAISAAFLFAIAIANILVLIGLYRSFRKVRRGEGFVEEDLNLLLANRGFFSRLLRSVFRLIGKSWHMYPLGVLFGLGFDTATEIGVLTLAAMGATQGLPLWAALIFPALFTAGMTLVDTTDSILMLRAYGWAYVEPVRKCYYNMFMTLLSVTVALLLGGIEVLGLFGDTIEFWNIDFGMLGYSIIGIFVFSWGMATMVSRRRGAERLRPGPAPPVAPVG